MNSSQPRYYSLLYPFYLVEDNYKIQSTSFWKIKNYNKRIELLNRELKQKNFSIALMYINQISEFDIRIYYLNEVAEIYAQLNYRDRAIEVLKQSFYLIQQNLEGIDKAEALSNVAAIYLGFGITKLGISYLENSIILVKYETQDLDNKELVLCEIALIYARQEEYLKTLEICDLINDKCRVWFRVIEPIIIKAVYFQEHYLVLDILIYSKHTGFFEAILRLIAEEYIKNNNLDRSIYFIERVKNALDKINLLILFGNACICNDQLEKVFDVLCLAEMNCHKIQGSTSKDIIIRQIHSLLQKLV